MPDPKLGGSELRHLVEEVVEVERLPKEVIGVNLLRRRRGIGRRTGDDQHWWVAAQGLQLLGELPAVHHGHVHVKDDEGRFDGLRGQERVESICGGAHAVARVEQARGNHVAHDVVIIDDEYGTTGDHHTTAGQLGEVARV